MNQSITQNQQSQIIEDENKILKQYILELQEKIGEQEQTIANLQLRLQEIEQQITKQQVHQQIQEDHLNSLLKRVSWQVTSGSVQVLTQSLISKICGQSIPQQENLTFNQAYEDQSVGDNAIHQEIFEAFYIFGIEKIDSNNQSYYVLPSEFKILYKQYKERFKDQPKNQDFQKFKEIEALIEQFIRPSRFQAEIICEEDIDIQISKITQQRIQSENFYMINLKGDDLQLTNPSNIKILQQFNHERQLYGYCVIIDDFLRETKRDGTPLYWKVKKILCFVTFFPIQHVFYQLFEQILYIIKYLRQLVKRKNEDPKIQFDGVQIIKETEQILNMMIQKLSEYSIKNYEQNIVMDFSTITNNLKLPKELLQELQNIFTIFKVEYQVPKQPNLYFEIKKMETHIILKLFKLEQFFTIFEEILREGKIVFCCQNQRILTAVLSFFYTILKPFKWFHQIIYNLQMESVLLEQFEMPILLGINMPYSSLKFNKKIMLLKQSQNILYVDIKDRMQVVNVIEYKDNQKKYWKNQKQILAQYFQQNQQNQQNCKGLLNLTPNETDEQKIRGFLEEMEKFIKGYLISNIIPKKRDAFVQEVGLNDQYIFRCVRETIKKQIQDQNDQDFLSNYVLYSQYFQEYLRHIYTRL